MFFSPFAAADHLDAARLTRQENIYVVGEAAKSKGRLIAFIGIDPLAPNALEEIAYWIEHSGARGIKLHLGNSGFDYRSKANLDRLAAVFSAASVAKLPIAIHMRSSKAFGAREANQFIGEVLPSAGNLVVQVAHAPTQSLRAVPVLRI
jgi:predicted TIM-barrel fold metal-dependent hydrolase